MGFSKNNQIKMTSGKIYNISGDIFLLPEKFFFREYNFGLDIGDNILCVNKDSNPSFFIFIDYVYDSHKTLYVKVLYKNNIYITQNEYHIGNFIELLK